MSKYRLVVYPNTTQAWEIQLKPGENLLGRGENNDFQIADPSVSTNHCRLVATENSVAFHDLGSTNGSFVNRAPTVEATLENGQTIRLGGVDMIFYAEAALAPTGHPPPRRVVLKDLNAEISAPSGEEKVIVIPAAAPRSAPLRISGSLTTPPKPSAIRLAGTEPAPEAEPPPRPVASPGVSPKSAGAGGGARQCKFHPKSPAQFLCNKCNRSFCEMCVTSLNTHGEVKKMCRTCGVECERLEVQLFAASGTKGFFGRVPGAFVYPFRGAGVFVMIVGLIIFMGLKLGSILIHTGNLRTVGMGVIMEISAGGYLFTYLQSILFSTSNEERELPSLPGIDNFLEDILLPFFRLLGLAIVCFGPAIGLAIISARITIGPALIAQLIGYLYFPMAFLAVAILDSVAAANPLLIIPSMFKAPLEYMFSLLFILFVNVVYFGGGFLISRIFFEGFETRSMGMLFGMIGANMLLSLLGLYLLLVAVHILGLIFVTKKDELGWLEQ